MCSEQQRELYSQFEPDANEAVFGQRTAPDRPLTDKEVSQRKRIILKLVDQKLKFDLIALMRQQQEQSDGSRACKIQISGPDLMDESNNNPSSIGGVCQIDTWSMESNFYAPQSFNQQLPTYQSLSYPSQHTVTQRFEFHNPTSYQFSRPTFQYLKPNRMRMAQSANVRPQREKSNPNLIQLPVVPKEIPATVTSDEVIVPKPSETITSAGLNKSSSTPLQEQSQSFIGSDAPASVKSQQKATIHQQHKALTSRDVKQSTENSTAIVKPPKLFLKETTIPNPQGNMTHKILKRKQDSSSGCIQKKRPLVTPAVAPDVIIEKSTTVAQHSSTTGNEVAIHSTAHSKIAGLIMPFLRPRNDINSVISILIRNPHALHPTDIIKSKELSTVNVMKVIKRAVDEFIPARLPKKFHIPPDRFVDVPFVVNLHDRKTTMTRESATELTKVLFDSIECLKTTPKPSLRDVKFENGSLKIVCLNRMSFDWLEKTISDHLGVSVCPVKNAISMNQLKTIRIKFNCPQYLHFNYMMQRLKSSNPRLYTHRWEQRSANTNNSVGDSTKWLTVGVDVESLIAMEEMNRVGTFRYFPVQFVISYDDNEENFEKMEFVKKKKQRKYKVA